MINKLWKSMVPVFKWGAVAAAGAAVVISIQANADGDRDSELDKPAAVQTAELRSDTMATPQDVVALSSRGPWTPAQGFADLIEDVSPAVVHVATSGFVERRRFNRNNRDYRQFRGPRGFEDFFEDFFGRPYGERDDQEPDPDQESDDGEKETRPLGIGSGFIISADGYVVTNHHVIDRADEIIVTLNNEKEYIAEVKGSDPKTDLALLKLKDAQDLPYVDFGDDEKSRVGDWVLAIGNPFGLGGSASTGIISAIGRDINAGPYDDFIQVDAAINRGNSGGPLFNMQGQVIGINSMIYSPTGGSVGIGFAIPANLAKGVIAQLQDSGSVERGWIGVSIGEVSEDLATAFGRDNQDGALVSQIQPDSPAEKAGVIAGDIILSFDGETIEGVRELPRVVANKPVGETYKMTVWRDGKSKNINITTERFPDDEAIAANNDNGPSEQESQSESVMGAEMSSLTSSLRSRYRVGKNIEGVVVTEVERGGLAANNGIQVGDVIMQFDSVRNITTPEQVADALAAAKQANKELVRILLYRRGAQGFTVFRLD